ncbi:checkpoint protein HUS1B [Macaca thibetana thibetana]|uniref:checkpoint protein HUS1B n=1 Tax=Macaca thibetana thibetana TaxID=257877 RepID=UPI0021BC6DF1|nr:checkpoint protein HUS1B [Macaca thibetana thibetana]
MPALLITGAETEAFCERAGGQVRTALARPPGVGSRPGAVEARTEPGTRVPALLGPGGRAGRAAPGTPADRKDLWHAAFPSEAPSCLRCGVMKFRAKITGKGRLELFIHVSGTVARLAKVCVLRVRPDSLCFGPAGFRGLREAGLWCEVRRGAFQQFHMEGVSEELDEIHLELTAEHLSRAARSAAGASSLKLQLTHRRRPCLTVAVALASPLGRARSVVHDLPVQVLPRRAWRDCPPPSLRAADASIHLPRWRTLRSIVERMANVGDHVLVEANLRGRMTLSMETEVVSIKSYFKNLGNPPESAGVPPHRDLESMVQVRVDNRKLLQFLEGQQINPTMALCNIWDNSLLQLVLVQEDVSLQCFIPAL